MLEHRKPSFNLLNRNWRAFALPLFLFGLAVVLRFLPGARTIDDAFITFRYARNILAGNGFVYNPGEHVLGTTTPFYTILLTGTGAFLGGTQAPFPQIALALNALADGLTAVMLLDLGRRLSSKLAGAAAGLAWAVAPFSVTFAIGGLETSVYVALLVGIAWAYLDKRRKLAALLGVLALLTRPDALILLGPLALDRAWVTIKPWITRRDAVGRDLFVKAAAGSAPEALIFFLPAASWVLFATFYFGSPIPHSIAAKSVAYRLPENTALVRLLQHYATPFMENLTFGVPAIAAGMILYLFLYLVGARKALRVTPRAWPFVAFPWLYFAAFALANPLIFRWYLTPPLPFYTLIILLGAFHLLENLAPGRPPEPDSESTPARRRFQPGTAVLSILLIAPALLNLHGWKLHPDHGLSRPAPEMAWYQLELLYREASQTVNQAVGPAAAPLPVLAAGDVGVLGYFTGTRILDTVGLNSPQTINYYPVDPDYYASIYAIPPDLIVDFKPDYVVILEVYGRNGLLKDPRFQKTYRLLRKLPTDIYDSDGMLVFEAVHRSLAGQTPGEP
jgi:hypothetical protein